MHDVQDVLQLKNVSMMSIQFAMVSSELHKSSSNSAFYDEDEIKFFVQCKSSSLIENGKPGSLSQADKALIQRAPGHYTRLREEKLGDCNKAHYADLASARHAVEQ